MANGAGTVEVVISEYGRALTILENLAEADEYQRLLAQLGIDDPPDLTADSAFVGKLQDVAAAADNLHAGIDDVSGKIDSDDLSAVVSAASELLVDCAVVVDALDQVGLDLPRATASLPNAAELAALAPNFTDRTLEDLLASYLDFAHPVGAAVLRLFGVIELVRVQLAFSPDGVWTERRRLFFNRLPTALTNPLEAWRLAYGWGQNDFDAQKLLSSVSNFLDVIGPLSGIPEDDPSQPPLLEMFGLTVQKSSDTPPGLEAALYLDVPDPQIVLAQLTNRWRFQLDLGGTFSEGLGIKLLPPFSLAFSPPSGASFAGHLGLVFVAQALAAGDSVELFSITSGCKIDAQSVTVGPVADLVWNGTTATAEFGIRLQVQGGRVLVQSSESDGFLSSLLPADGLALNFDATLSWSPSKGLRFEGGAGLLLTLLTNQKLGPITIQSLVLGLNINTDAVSVTAGVNGSAELGPITAIVQNVGVRLETALASRGSLGAGDLTIRFQPPNGIGIKVDAGPVTGGGFLYLDYDAGRYSGAVELSVYAVAVKAFGIIDTKFPDGHKGFSFIIIISAEFTPIQLGFGFTLLGVGGIVGINRTLDADSLSSIVRSHGLDNVLFPQDPVGDAPAIIADLGAIFPAAEGYYVFGPMAKLGWGTPTLIDAEIGVILVLPGPTLAILGEVHCVLPTQSFSLVELNFAIVGILDFPQKRFSLDASLHDSHVGDFPVSGDMAMRVSWGGDPNFALSIGGFHPAFKPPAGFPSLARVTVDLGSHGNPSLTLLGYLAITSNTAQVGARAELNAHGAGLRLHGFVGFDALFVFSPFSFTVDFSAGLDITFHGYGIGLHAQGQISGPTPWHIAGSVSVSILFWDASLDFSKTFGGSARVELPALDPFLGSPAGAPLESQEVVGLQNALQDPRNWSSVAPEGAFTAVSLAQASGDAPPPIDPMGAASLHQRVVPLNRAITLFAGAKPVGPGTYSVAQVTLSGGIAADISTVQDKFAPAAFKKMSDAEKLSSPSFEKMDAGVSVSANRVTIGTVVPRNIAFNTIVIDPRASTPPVAPDYQLTARHLSGMSARSATALAGLRVTGTQRFIDPTMPVKVVLADVSYIVALVSNLTQAAGFFTSTSKSTLSIAVEVAVAAAPALASQLQIIPLIEAA